MSTTYDRCGLGTIGNNDPGWDVPLNANVARITAFATIGALCVREHEIPSTTRAVAISAGSFWASDGSLVTYAGTASFTCGASVTTMLWLDETGTLQSATSWPTATNVMRLATVQCSGSVVTNISDSRLIFSSHGGPVRGAIRSVSASTTTTDADELIIADATSAAVTITVASPAAALAGRRMYFHKSAGTYDVILSAAANIDGASTITLTRVGDSFILEWTGSTWIQLHRPHRLKYRTLTTGTTLLDDDEVLLLDASAGAFTVTLTDPSSTLVGQRKYFKKLGPANTVAITSASNIDGVGSLVLYTSGDAVHLEWTGATWVQLDRPARSVMRTVTATATLLDSDETIIADATAGAMTLTIPNPDASLVGKRMKFKKIDNVNNVTIGSAANIDGAATVVLSTQWAKLIIEWTGSTWVTF